MPKTLTFALIIGILLISFAVFYYLVVFLPQIERDRLKGQKYDDCLSALKIYQTDKNMFKDLFNNGPKSVDDCLKYLPQK